MGLTLCLAVFLRQLHGASYLGVTLGRAGFDQPAAGTREEFAHSSIDWGDGTVTTTPQLNLSTLPGREGLETTGTLRGTHRYEHGGVYRVTATVSDDDGGSDTVTTTVQVTGVGIVDRTLYVVGTDGRDYSKVWFNERQNTVSVYAHLNRHGWLGLRGERILRTYSLDDVDQIVSLLGDGHDQFLMHDGFRRRAAMTLPVAVDSGAGNDFVRTGNGAATIMTGAGNDVIITGAGHDTIDAGDGHNRIWSGAGNDHITAGSGNDYVEAGGDDDIIDVGHGSNIVDTGHGNDTVSTGDGNDCIHAPSGNNIIESGAGHDWIRTGDGEDRIDAGSGDDDIHSGGGNDLILGRSGDDELHAGDGDDIVIGGSGRDRIYGSRGQDLLIAGSIDASTDQLDDLFADWNASMDLFDRVQSLQDGQGGLGTPLVDMVADDDAPDVIHGGSGRDWVLATRLGAVTDRVRTKRNDLFTEIPN